MAHPNQRARSRLKKYLTGDGLELGALHMPLDIAGTKIKSVKYVDRMSEENLRKHYPELSELPLVKIDIIDDAATLKTVANNSVDFIIANHIIEHLSDPIGAILCWFSKLKTGGLLYMAVPDKRKSFDIDRPLTDLQHIIDDHYCTAEQRKTRDREAFYEWSRLVNKTSEDKVEQQVADLIQIDYSIHYHTFTFESMRRLIEEVRRQFCPELKIFMEQPTAIRSYECIFLLAKEVMPQRLGLLTKLRSFVTLSDDLSQELPIE
jgi:2-polyprenyl-3-methyl-5-hydroxy-6-metoxy-1,4-benzoquinol methylase